jgi:polar amino acid transport system permease protein
VRRLSPTLESIVLLAALSFVLAWAFRSLGYDWNWSAVWEYREKLASGWLMTVQLAIFSLFVSTALGLLLALMQSSRLPFVATGSKLYVELIRGTPLLVQILVFFYVLAEAVGLRDRYVVGVLTLSSFSGAYMSEIFRAGFASVGKTQIDTALSLGLTRWQVFRYVRFPLALRLILPPMGGQFASLVKDSSLLSIIAIGEFTLAAQEVNSFTFSTLETYLPLALGYLVLTLPFSLLSRRLEQRLRYET